jgi:hypothetical protein
MSIMLCAPARIACQDGQDPLARSHPPPDDIKMSAISRLIAGVCVALLMFGDFRTCASAQGSTSRNVVVLLRLAGDSGADTQIQSCLTARLSRMPDIEIGTPSTAGVRFAVDIITEKEASTNISASLVVVETFPMEEFRPRMKEGEDRDALLNSMRFYTLLRLHELVPGRSYQALCARISAEIGDKVLSKEYTDRND